MICQIVQNGGYMFLILCLWISAVTSTSEDVYTIQEYCSGNLYIHSVQPGEPYFLTIKTGIPTSGVPKWFQKSKRRCRKEFKTGDPAAHFEVNIWNMSIPTCSGTLGNCQCNYFVISAGEHKKRYCGEEKETFFASKSDTLVMDFHPGITMKFDVSFIFTVKRNSYIITGPAKNSPYESSSYIETPYFPAPYPPSYKVEYEFQSDDEDGYVLLLFLDFQVPHDSFIEVTGQNGSHPARYYGNLFRPPVIVSQSNRLSLKFESNNQPGLIGFRAICSFIKSRDNLAVPYTDCGGHKIERSGYLSINPRLSFSQYDCIWKIIPSLILSKSYLDIAIELRNISHKSSLEFRKGYNSKSEILKIIDCEVENCDKLETVTTVAATETLYIRFNGYLDAHSIINMTYGTYHKGNCSVQEFKCNDGRCLVSEFHCDGIKHCPGGEDEEKCTTTTLTEITSTLPTIKAENISTDVVLSKFLAIIAVGILGLIAIIAVVILLTKKYKIVIAHPQPSPMQHVIREMTDVQPTMYPVNMFNDDSPPSYDDFIKSSDCYPPLLYTRARNFIMPNTCSQCTTTFSTGARVRHHSARSFRLGRISDADNDIFSSMTESSDSYSGVLSRCDRGSLKSSKKPSIRLKRSNSLDSKINDLIKQDSCHLFLSIIHPVCNHKASNLTHVQCHTLPSNFKMNCSESNSNTPSGAAWLPPESSVNFVQDRRFTWSFIPVPSTSDTEVLTVMKGRCCSDPCKGVSVHCSL